MSIDPQLGLLSYPTGLVVSYTHYKLAEVEGESKVRSILKTATIKLVDGLHSLALFIESAVRFIFGKIKEFVSSAGFQNAKAITVEKAFNVKDFVVDKAVIAKDYIADMAGKLYSAISNLQQPPAEPKASV